MIKHLAKGVYLGPATETFRCGSILLSENEYFRGPQLPWHCHENPFFMYVLSGRFVEQTKKTSRVYVSGNIVYHHSHDPHKDVHDDYSRLLHVELDRGFLAERGLPQSIVEGYFSLEDPSIGILFAQIYDELRIRDAMTSLSVEGLLLSAFGKIARMELRVDRRRPSWVGTLEEILREESSTNMTLRSISQQLQLHPVHLSRQFPKYFQSTFGEYRRKARIQKSIQIMHSNPERSLAEIAFECGFSDQSHFIRSFRRILGVSPTIYRGSLRTG